MRGGETLVEGRVRPRLFITYANKAPGHKDSARELATLLRQRGFRCTLDQDVEPAPPEGWVPWMHREMQRAERILILWSREYRDSVQAQERRGAPFEFHLLLKLAFAKFPSLDGFISCLSKESDRQYVDVLFSDHVSFVVPHDSSKLVGHLCCRSPSSNDTSARSPDSEPRARSEATHITARETVSRFVFDFSKEAAALDGGHRLDLLSGLRHRLARARRVHDGHLLREILLPRPQGERQRILELVHTAGEFSLLRYPGHNARTRIGDPVPRDEPHEFDWLLSPGRSMRVHGRLLLSEGSGFLLLSRVGATPSIRVEIRQLPRPQERDSQ